MFQVVFTLPLLLLPAPEAFMVVKELLVQGKAQEVAKMELTIIMVAGWVRYR